MKNRSYIILSCAILFSSYSIACDCALKKLAELQKSSYEYSDCIFIGEIIEIDKSNHSFEIKVIESLDGGDEHGNLYIVKQITSCDIFTQEKGKWIVYADSNEEGFITMDMCSLNRPFERPFSGAIDLVDDHNKSLEERLIIEKEVLVKEISTLREKRDQPASI